MSQRIQIHLTPDELITLGNTLLTVLEHSINVPGTPYSAIAELAAHVTRKIKKMEVFQEPAPAPAPATPAEAPVEAESDLERDRR